jgi:UDP-N-acetylglucosamine 2-epimerase (hydrolysing)
MWSNPARAFPKRILFLTGTRADYGKLKPLIRAAEASPDFDVKIFVTGMHTLEAYGYTVDEVRAGEHKNIHVYCNQIIGEPMDIVLANTIVGISRLVHGNPPDLIVVHGDRVEALAGAIVGSMRNILTAHIEGGELSGTVDELIRHSVSKLSHIHFVANEDARKRLVQMGETWDSIFVIGSPDIDVMLSGRLPSIAEVKSHYEIPFDKYGIAIFHPVTTELDKISRYAESFVDALVVSEKNFVVIYPNNDHGSEIVLRAYDRLKRNLRFRVLPSLRFEFFLTLLKNASFIIGNSSASIREAPVYGVPAINIGSRQKNRFHHKTIINVENDEGAIVAAIEHANAMGQQEPSMHFGRGNSADLFMAALRGAIAWELPRQKQFVDIPG